MYAFVESGGDVGLHRSELPKGEADTEVGLPAGGLLMQNARCQRQMKSAMGDKLVSCELVYRR